MDPAADAGTPYPGPRMAAGTGAGGGVRMTWDRVQDGRWIDAIGSHPECVDCTKKADGQCRIADELDEAEREMDEEANGRRS